MPLEKEIRMNANHALVLLVFVGYCYTSGGAMDNPSEHRLKVSGVDLPVLFEDQSLNEEQKRTILQDYRQILAGMEPQGIRDSRVQKYEGDVGDVRVDKQIQHSAKYLKRPDGYEDQYGLVGTSNNGLEQVVIPKLLSDGYKSAIDLVNAHSEAYESLPEFIQLMNHLDAGKLPLVREMFYLHGGAKEFADELDNRPIQEFINDYGKHRYALGSLLEMAEADGRLVADMYVIDTKSGKRVDEMPIIYDGGHWKIFITMTGN